MKSFILFIVSILVSVPSSVSIDFGKDGDGKQWQVINDGVMGGLSRGKITFDDGAVLFKGTVSLANNGGFSSFKSPFGKTDLSDYQTVEMRFKASGQAFALTMETDYRWYAPYFKKDFTTDSEEWVTVKLDLKDFDQYRIGTKTGNRLTERQLEKIIRLGITTNSKKEGPFELLLDYIKFE